MKLLRVLPEAHLKRALSKIEKEGSDVIMLEFIEIQLKFMEFH